MTDIKIVSLSIALVTVRLPHPFRLTETDPLHRENKLLKSQIFFGLILGILIHKYQRFAKWALVVCLFVSTSDV